MTAETIAPIATILCQLCDEPVEPGAQHPDKLYCHRSCVERKQRELAIAWDEKNPYQQKEGRPHHWQLADIRVIERDSPEGQELLRRRKERMAAPSVVAGDVARLVGVA